MIHKKRQYSLFIILALLFLTPGLGAYFFYQHPSWLTSSKVNKGLLLQPPPQLQAFDKGKWKLLFWSPGPCDEACLQQVDNLAKIRLALGRKFYEVSLWLLLNEGAPPLNPRAQELLDAASIRVHTVSHNQSNRVSARAQGLQLFIANPDNYLILGYPQGVQLDDVYADLKLLLNTSQYKSDTHA